MSPSTLKLILLALSFSLPSVLTAPVPQIEFEIGGLVDGLTRGGLEGEKRSASPSPEPEPQGFLLGNPYVPITEEKVKRQVEFGVGGLFDGLTRGGLEGEKRNASPEPEPKPQVEFGVGGFPVEDLTRGGLEGEKREASPEPVPQSYGISGGGPIGLTRGGKRDPQIEFGVGGFPVEGLTRGGLAGEKREAAPEPVPQGYAIPGGEPVGFSRGG
jgi:hypothetical protein